MASDMQTGFRSDRAIPLKPRGAYQIFFDGYTARLVDTRTGETEFEGQLRMAEQVANLLSQEEKTA